MKSYDKRRGQAPKLMRRRPLFQPLRQKLGEKKNLEGQEKGVNFKKKCPPPPRKEKSKAQNYTNSPVLLQPESACPSLHNLHGLGKPPVKTSRKNRGEEKNTKGCCFSIMLFPAFFSLGCFFWVFFVFWFLFSCFFLVIFGGMFFRCVCQKKEGMSLLVGFR